MEKVPRPQLSTLVDLLVLAAMLTVFAYLSQFYLSQQIDDTLDITVMSEFPRFISNQLSTNAWFFPFTVPIQSAYDPLVLPSLVGNLIHSLLGDWVLTQRVEAVLLVFATAASMYLVSVRIIKDRYGALFAASAFAFASNFVMRMPSHLSLLGGFVFPLLLYSFMTRRYAIAGFVMGIAYWSSPEFGLMAVLLAASYFVFEWLQEHGKLRELFLHYALSALVFVAMTAFLVPSSLAVGGGTTNTLVNLFWRGQFAVISPGSSSFLWEQSTAYLGLTTIAAAAIVVWKKRDRFNLYLLTLAVLFLLLSTMYLPVWPFQDIRIPGRFSVVALFCLSLLAGQVFTIGVVKGKMLRRVLVLTLLVLLIADNAVGPPPWISSPPPFQWNDPGYQIIKADPNATAQVDFPILPTAAGLVYYQYEGVLTGKAVVDGQTSGLAAISQSDSFFYNIQFLRNFLIQNVSDKFTLSYSADAFKVVPSSYDFWLLKGWGITYLVLHKALYSDIGGTAQAEQFLANLTKLGWVTNVYDDKYITIDRITIGDPAVGVASPSAGSVVLLTPEPAQGIRTGDFGVQATIVLALAVITLVVHTRVRRPGTKMGNSRPS